jgi:hypothetical protein
MTISEKPKDHPIQQYGFPKDMEKACLKTALLPKNTPELQYSYAKPKIRKTKSWTKETEPWF